VARGERKRKIPDAVQSYPNFSQNLANVHVGEVLA
jgi:hypothetical protein